MNTSIPLKLSNDSPTKRIIIGLSWDMRELKKFKLAAPEFIKNLGDTAIHYASGLEGTIHAMRSSMFYKDHLNPNDNPEVRNTEFEQFDLDLECYVFDQDGNRVQKISPDYTEIHNEDLSVFHSSEDYTGVGVFDDEDISIKMNSLPEAYHHFLFVVKSDCAFDINDIHNPAIRIYDAYTNEETNKTELKPDIANSSAYIYAHLYKKDGDWAINLINKYCDYYDDFEAYFKNNLLN